MRLLDFFEQRASFRNIGIAFLIALVTGAIMMIGITPQVDAITGGLGLLDTRLFYTFDDVVDLFTLLGPTGLQLYTYQKIVDMIFPLGFGFPLVFLQVLAVRRLTPSSNLLRALPLIPFLGMLFDYAENLLVWSQIAAFPGISPTIVGIAAIATFMKWSVLGLAIVVLIGTAIYSQLRKKG